MPRWSVPAWDPVNVVVEAETAEAAIEAARNGEGEVVPTELPVVFEARAVEPSDPRCLDEEG